LTHRYGQGESESSRHFDEAALLYDEVRPGYPEELFDDVVPLYGIPSGGRILEIWCVTGCGRWCGR